MSAGESRKPHILAVFTGGTISSRSTGRVFEISDPPHLLLQDIPEDTVHFDICEPFSILSENMTPEMLFRLFGTIAGACSAKIYDGILIAHGTDTMGYTAQLAHLLLSGLGIPVVFVGSKKPLDDPESDGVINFRNALALLSQITSGVFVVSRNIGGTNYVHSAGKILQADPQTNDFYSYKNQYFGIMTDGHLEENDLFPSTDSPVSARSHLRRLSSLGMLPSPETVLVLDACVGINFRSLLLTRREFSFVLQRLYHSGTACTEPRNSPYSLLYLQDMCKANGKQLFIAPIEKDRIPYSTTRELLDAGVTPVYDLPFEAVWAGLLLYTWLEEKPEEFFNSPG